MELQSARVEGALKKVLAGKRLGPSDLTDLDDVLPKVEDRGRGYGRPPEDLAAEIGLSRRSFFRWVADGRAYNDLLPFDAPAEVPAWYERMRLRGVFKHRCPKAVLDACGSAPNRPAEQGPKSPANDGHASSAAPPATPPTGGALRMFLSDDTALDLNADIDKLHRALVAYRSRAEQNYREGHDDAANQDMARALEMLDKVTMAKQRALKIEDSENLAYPKEDLARDLGAIARGIVTNFLQAGRGFHIESQSALPREAFLALWRRLFKAILAGLVESKFAPPLEFEEAA